MLGRRANDNSAKIDGLGELLSGSIVIIDQVRTKSKRLSVPSDRRFRRFIVLNFFRTKT